MTGRHVRIRTARGSHRAQRFLDALFSVGALEEDSSPEVDIPQSTSPDWGRSALDGAQGVIPGAPRLGITPFTPIPPRSARSHVNGGRSGVDTLPRRIIVECEAPGCGATSWGATKEIFDKHTALSGPSQVKRTRAGAWACRSHAYMIGGGW